MERQTAHAIPEPFVSIEAPPEPFFNEEFTFDVLFKNEDTNDVGYGPFIDVELPPAFAYNGANYLGVPLDDSVPLVCPVEGTYEHPLTGEERNCTEGNTVVVITLPFGSFVPSQPAVHVTIQSFVKDDNPGVVGTAQTLRATGGFRFGALATGSAPLWQAVQETEVVTPAIIRLRKEYLGPEDETATGPNFPREYRVIADIADGQTLTDFRLTDLLPDNLAFVSVTPVTAGGAVEQAPPVDVASNPPVQRDRGPLGLRHRHHGRHGRPDGHHVLRTA